MVDERERAANATGRGGLPWDPKRIEAALAGGADANNQLARALLPEVVILADRELRPWSAHYKRSGAAIRDDVVQDVMLKLFGDQGRVLRAWRPHLGLSLRGFLKRVVRFHVLQLFRSGVRHPWRDESIGDRRPESDSATASALLHQLWVWQIRDSLLASETPTGRALYLALFVEQEDATEVGHRHGMTRDAVYQWRARFKRRAARALSEREEGRRA
ncbi:MAG: RNA polymerase sigma factor [Nannocystaceae bacterium]|nr:hypothetical protein [bacterium]